MTGTCFLAFAGQGTQTPGMGRGLAARHPAADRIIEEASTALGLDMREILWGSSSSVLTRTENAQPAIVTVAVAALRAWQHAGATVDVVWTTGHSVGAIGAAIAGGAIEFADGVRLARRRGQLMAQAPGDGAMLAVAVTSARTMHITESVAARLGLDIACVNGSRQLVLSGERSQVASARQELGARSQPLDVSHAFHSRLMDPVLPAWREQLAATEFRDPSMPYRSANTGALLTSMPEVKQDLFDGLRQTVRWDLVTQAALAGTAHPLVLGSGKALTRMWRGTRLATDAVVVDDDFRGRAHVD